MSDSVDNETPRHSRYNFRRPPLHPDSPNYKDLSSSELEDDEEVTEKKKVKLSKPTPIKTPTGNQGDDLDEVDSRKNKTKARKRSKANVGSTKSETDIISDQDDNLLKESSKKKTNSLKLEFESIRSNELVNRETASSSESHSHFWRYCAITFAVLALFVLCYIFLPLKTVATEYNSEPDVGPTRAERVEEFSKSMDELKTKFPMQTQKFWKVIKAAVLSNLRIDDPLYPAIVLIASHKSNHVVVECLTKKMANIALKAYLSEGVTEISGKKLSTFTADGAAKLELDVRYSRGFADGVKVSILKDLEQSPGEIGLMLHSYCDNENAPFKDALFIFTVYVEADCDVSEESVEKKLATSWRTLKADQYDAIWSRIGNNVAVVSHEDETVLKQC